MTVNPHYGDKTDTVFVSRLATQTMLEFTVMAIGNAPTGRIPASLFVLPSITETVLEPELVTYTVLVFGLTATELLTWRAT